MIQSSSPRTSFVSFAGSDCRWAATDGRDAELIEVHETYAFEADGSYVYTLDNSSLIVQQLAAGQSVTDVFTYTADDLAGTIPHPGPEPAWKISTSASARC